MSGAIPWREKFYPVVAHPSARLNRLPDESPKIDWNRIAPPAYRPLSKRVKLGQFRRPARQTRP